MPKNIHHLTIAAETAKSGASTNANANAAATNTNATTTTTTTNASSQSQTASVPAPAASLIPAMQPVTANSNQNPPQDPQLLHRNDSKKFLGGFYKKIRIPTLHSKLHPTKKIAKN